MKSTFKSASAVRKYETELLQEINEQLRPYEDALERSAAYKRIWGKDLPTLESADASFTSLIARAFSPFTLQQSLNFCGSLRESEGEFFAALAIGKPDRLHDALAEIVAETVAHVEQTGSKNKKLLAVFKAAKAFEASGQDKSGHGLYNALSPLCRRNEYDQPVL